MHDEGRSLHLSLLPLAILVVQKNGCVVGELEDLDDGGVKSIEGPDTGSRADRLEPLLLHW